MYWEECLLSDKGDRYRDSLGADTVGGRLTASRSGKGRLPVLALRHPTACLRMARAQAAVVGQPPVPRPCEQQGHGKEHHQRGRRNAILPAFPLRRFGTATNHCPGDWCPRRFRTKTAPRPSWAETAPRARNPPVQKIQFSCRRGRSFDNNSLTAFTIRSQTARPLRRLHGAPPRKCPLPALFSSRCGGSVPMTTNACMADRHRARADSRGISTTKTRRAIAKGPYVLQSRAYCRRPSSFILAR